MWLTARRCGLMWRRNWSFRGKLNAGRDLEIVVRCACLWVIGEDTGSTRPSEQLQLASSTGRCNTLQYVDSAMLLRENHLFGCTRPKPSQGSVLAGLTLASDFGFCFQCQAGSSLVLRRPIEITLINREV